MHITLDHHKVNIQLWHFQNTQWYWPFKIGMYITVALLSSQVNKYTSTWLAFTSSTETAIADAATWWTLPVLRKLIMKATTSNKYLKCFHYPIIHPTMLRLIKKKYRPLPYYKKREKILKKKWSSNEKRREKTQAFPDIFLTTVLF